MLVKSCFFDHLGAAKPSRKRNTDILPPCKADYFILAVMFKTISSTVVATLSKISHDCLLVLLVNEVQTLLYHKIALVSVFHTVIEARSILFISIPGPHLTNKSVSYRGNELWVEHTPVDFLPSHVMFLFICL